MAKSALDTAATFGERVETVCESCTVAGMCGKVTGIAWLGLLFAGVGYRRPVYRGWCPLLEEACQRHDPTRRLSRLHQRQRRAVDCAGSKDQRRRRGG